LDRVSLCPLLLLLLLLLLLPPPPLALCGPRVGTPLVGEDEVYLRASNTSLNTASDSRSACMSRCLALSLVVCVVSGDRANIDLPRAINGNTAR
jgi:hypothetical protein